MANEPQGKDHKPECIALAGGPDLSQQHVIDLCRKLFGRELTPEEIDDIRKTLPMLPGK